MSDKKSQLIARRALKNLQKRDRPKKIGFSPLSAVLVTLGIYFGSQIIAGYAVLQYLLATGTSSSDISSAIENSTPLQFGFIFIAEAASLGLLWLFLKRRKISLPQIGVKKPSSKNLIYALPGYAIYFLIILTTVIFIDKFVPAVNVNQDQQIGFESAAGFGLFFVFIALVILPALIEEILVRGFLYSGLRKKFTVVKAALVASFIFGIAHLQFGTGENLVWIAAIDTFVLSMVLIWLREKTGNIWSGVVVHMIKNSLAFTSLFLLK